MIETIRIKKGFDINLKGKAEKRIVEISPPETYALKPTDFIGIKRPKLLVKEGDTVQAGTPILFCKKNEKIKYVSPISGEIAAIVRGEKRKLLEVRILADKDIKYAPAKKYSSSEIHGLSKQDITNILCDHGVWPNIIQRPYGIIANPEDEPRDIFVSGYDSSPLAPDFDFVYQEQEQYIQTGVDILNKFISGQVHISVDANAEFSKVFSQLKGIKLHKISGPHPSGNVGIQIHHIKPINKGDILWTTTPFGLAQIGKLFMEGKYDAERIIALTGPEVKNPQYYKIRTGTSIKKFLENNLLSDNIRVISGNVLTGEKIAKDSYLGFYHNQITVLEEGNKPVLLGWFKPTFKELSVHRALGLFSFLNPKKTEYNLNTNTRGDKRAFVLSGVFEKVLPMDIYPTHLFKAIITEDYDEMEALGIYEVIEEDVALCEFVDVSKHNIQQIVRDGLELLQNS
jgi:Na+-transporting NADH:ubiquinone oxidoreductase subunit A